jgi:hypothetical protein
MAEKEVDLDALAEAEESFRPSWAAMESSPVAVAPEAEAAAAEAAPIVPTAVISVGGSAPVPPPPAAMFTNDAKPLAATTIGVAPPAPGATTPAPIPAEPVREKIESADVIEAEAQPAPAPRVVASVPPPAAAKADVPVPIAAVEPVEPLAKGFTTYEDDEIIIPKKGGGKGLVIGVVAVLLLGGVGAGVKFGLMGDEKQAAKPVTSATASQATPTAPTMDIPPPPDKEELAAQEAAKAAPPPTDSAKPSEAAPTSTSDVGKPTSEGTKVAEPSPAPAPVHASVAPATHPKVATAPAPAPAPKPRAPAPAPAPAPKSNAKSGGIVRDSPF